MNFNPFELLKNAQNIKEQLAKVQEELKDYTATGSSGGGIVKVTVNGQLEFVAVEIDPIAVDPRDVKMLQDLIIAAAHDASERIKEMIKEKAGPLMGGMNIPGMEL
ncbi:MAG: YbaB/EbfC family nucleoid-associated protein [Treponemataceae bacterium]|nr:YbaB/EbfC family nucleoid-associated protein [Treponemataceae bacterium]